MKKRFIFDENYIKRYAKKDKMKWLILGVSALILIIIIIIVSLASRHKEPTPVNPVVPSYELKEELTLEAGSTLPEVVDYFDKLENIDINDIKITYPEEFELSYDKSACTEEEIEEINNAQEDDITKFECAVPVLATPATYGITISLQENEYTVNLVVVDTEPPQILTKDVEIYMGEDYKIEDFVNICVDQSNECILSYYDGDVDSDGKAIDYSKIVDPGEHTIKIVAEDAYGNKSDPVEVKLTITKSNNTLYTITFNSNGGSAVLSQLVEENNKSKKPEDPTKEGYDFKGWYYNNKEFDFESTVTKDITLIAKWEKISSGKPNTNPEPKPGVINVSSVSLDFNTIYLEVGESKTVKAYVYPSNASNKSVSWKTENKGIATVSEGKITGVKAGTVKITATSGGKSASVTVIVKDKNSSSTTCKYGDASYNSSYILSVNLTNNGCAVNPNNSYNETVSAKDSKSLAEELSNIGFRVNKDYFEQKYTYIKVKNKSGTGLVGYQIVSKVSVIDPDNPYVYMSAEYTIRPDGSRQFTTNNISKNGIKLQ